MAYVSGYMTSSIAEKLLFNGQSQGTLNGDPLISDPHVNQSEKCFSVLHIKSIVTTRYGNFTITKPRALEMYGS